MAAKKTILILSLIVLITSIFATQALSFDPNLYSFLIYDTEGSEDSIQQAMQILGITYHLRNHNNPVTLTDLQTHNILIVGWNVSGDTSGLSPSILSSGITGRVLLSGHDADFHTVNGSEAARKFLLQAIEFVLAGRGTGLITLGEASAAPAPFSYLPSEWGISAKFGGGQTVKAFTAEGVTSGVYDGLTPGDMSNWGGSYHDRFTAWGTDFVSFELGGTGEDIVTIARMSGIKLTKVDNVNDGDCVGPGRQITYTIDYNYPAGPNQPDINDVNIIDNLPAEVDFNSASSGRVYDSGSRTVTWHIGTLHPGDKGSVTLITNVNTSAEPGGTITNNCEIKSGEQLLNSAYEYTSVCWHIIYADTDANGANNGTSWKNAYNYLQNALQDANKSPGYKEIWVAGGTYKPDCNSAIPNGSHNRNAAFRLINEVKIKGGYAGYGELYPNARDTNFYKTILSGDIGTPDVNTDNSYHVIIANNIDETAILDGFTITAGDANGSSPYNAGGGMYNHNGNPVVINCIFTENIADANGGGMCNKNSNPKITNCIFSENLAGYGGGISDSNSSPTITNCTFTKNTADANGGGIYNNSSSPTIINCILWDNNSPKNPQIYNYNNSSPIITYSDIQDGLPWDPDTDPDLKFNLNFENNNDPCTIDAGPSHLVGHRSGYFGYEDHSGEANTTPDSGTIYETAYSMSGLGTDANFCYVHDHDTTTPNDVRIRIPIAMTSTANYDAGTEIGDSMFDLAGTPPTSPIRTWAFWMRFMPKNNTLQFLNDAATVIHAGCTAGSVGPGGSSNRDPNYYWEIRLYNNKLQFQQRNGSTAQGVLLTAETADTVLNMGVDPRTWHHVAVVVDRNAQANTKIYLDGLQRAVNVVDYRTTTALALCHWTYGSTHYYIPLTIGAGRSKCNELLDEIRLYNKALTPYQISILFGSHNIADPCFVVHHNIDADPRFVNPDEGNYRLLSNSPCIDAGYNYSVPPDYADLDNDGNTTEPTPFDLDGFPRFIDGDCNSSSIVDMGAYEFSHAYLGDFDGDCNVDFQDFAFFALTWRTKEGQTNYKPICDISIPADRKINMLDLEVFAQNWLWRAGM